MNRYCNDFYEDPPISKDIHGREVKRYRCKYPYSYDPYCIYKSNNWTPDDVVNYSDRLMQWDYDKFTKCMKMIWGENCGQYFNNKEPKDIEKFLNLYYAKNIELTGIEQGCNVATGYPYWIFYYKTEEI